MSAAPPFPKGVRLAEPGDEWRLREFFVFAHACDGYGTLSMKLVDEMLHRICHRQNHIAAIIDGPERIEAVIALQPAKTWYSDPDLDASWYWTDILTEVHPMHRRSRHAMKLMQFAVWWQHETQKIVELPLHPRDKLDEKEKLFGRYGKRAGSFWLIGGSDVLIAAQAPRAVLAPELVKAA